MTALDLAPSPAPARAGSRADLLRRAAHAATIYAMPLLVLENLRRRFVARHGANRLAHERALVDAKQRFVTTPNHDTLHTQAWLDLAHGPIRLAWPAAGERYLSLALMDMFSNNFAVLGQRASGPDGGEITLVGPDASSEGIAGPVVRAPTRHVRLAVRVLTSGGEDLPAAHAIQDGIRLDALAPAPEAPGIPVAREAPRDLFLAEADRLLALHRPPATDGLALSRMAPLGVGAGRFDPAAFDAAEARAVAEGVDGARRWLVAAQTSRRGRKPGWQRVRFTLGDWGQDYVFRASIAVGAVAALPVVVAFCMMAHSAADGPFEGARLRRLTIPGDRPIPAGSFWSITLYDPTEDGRFFFHDNPLGRYAIGDRTPGLTRGPDGSIEIWIGAADPGPSRRANWPPAGAGPYQLVMRAYLPAMSLLEGGYDMPQALLAD